MASTVRVDLDSITHVMRRIAAGDFSARLERDLSGDESDVLAFLVNSLAEEVGTLVEELHREREELRATRDLMVQTEKLAALGLLAGGVAHEINQPLTVIHSLVGMMRMSEEVPISEHADDLDLVVAAAERIGRIVDSVRTYGRADPFALEPIDPLGPVADALVLVGDVLRQSGVRVVERIADDRPTILADAKRLEQVFVNLLSNARDALAECPPGERVVEISLRVVADWLVYEVRDTGPGVPADIASRIFDPFYTTKPAEQGTGLGLSVSLGIVEEHGGQITYQPTSDGWCRFVVKLPLSRATFDDAAT
ncbi:MAG: GHKL domain-containing protein [Myxococcales bacterium FL481]|nr:MAG: GHKL domain-containing protein [Myxococcales bacterium FL481]